VISKKVTNILLILMNSIKVLVFLVIVEVVCCEDFIYPKYTFRKKSNWARKYKSLERNCKETPCAAGKDNFKLNLEQLKCVRLCISEKCYKELYEWNELEAGEIDVRLVSFKGCVAKELRENSDKELKEKTNKEL